MYSFKTKTFLYYLGLAERSTKPWYRHEESVLFPYHPKLCILFVHPHFGLFAICIFCVNSGFMIVIILLIFPQNTIVGRMAYFPIVGRLDCGSSSAEHQGFWQLDGYGIMSIYKSDWDRFGGKLNSNANLFYIQI